MSLRGVDLNLLVVFDALMRERSVTKAAEYLFVSQSAVSHALNRLRKLLDDPLLVRSAQGMYPTRKALDLTGSVQDILKSIEQEFLSSTVFDPAITPQQFYIVASDYLDFLLLPALLKYIHQTAPGIDILVKKPPELFPQRELENSEVDLVMGFVETMELPPQFPCNYLFDDYLVTVVRKGHPEIGDTLTLEQYVRMTHLLISPSGADIQHGIVDDWLALQQLKRRVAAVVPHFLSAPLIVAHTDMVLTLPYRVAKQFIEMVPLKVLPVPINLPHYKIGMVWHPSRNEEPALKWFMETILLVVQQSII